MKLGVSYQRRAWFRSYSRVSWKSRYASKSPLARSALSSRIASAPTSRQRAPVNFIRSRTRYRHAPSSAHVSTGLRVVARQAGDGRRTTPRRTTAAAPAVICSGHSVRSRTGAAHYLPRAIRGQPHQAARLVDARLTISRRALPVEPPQVTIVAPATNREGPPVAHCAPSHSAAGQSGASPATARSAMHRNLANELPPLDKTLPFSSASR